MQGICRIGLAALTLFSATFWASCAKISGPPGAGPGGSKPDGGGNTVEVSRSLADGQVISSNILSTCGNSRLDATENCDDGNKVGGDGCTPLCQVESDWLCPTVGQACVNQARCGDSKLASNEACDDGNTAAGDGCSANCQAVETGWQCRVAGKRCVPLCGDGMLTGGERCDDKNTMAGDGCSPTCLTEPGATCPVVGMPCTLSVCGNGKVEEGESCDAGAALNGLFFGNGTGCSKTCTKEPICRDMAGVTRACDLSCGNGNVEGTEECDDGNLANGDGCSSACKPEAGFTCAPEVKPDTEACVGGAAGDCLHLPVIVRDFKSEKETGGHPDFFFLGTAITPPVSIAGVLGQPNPMSFSRRYCVPNSSGPVRKNDSTARCWDLAKPTLDAMGKPVFNAARTGGNLCDCQFTDWSHDTNGGHVPGYTAPANSPATGLVYTAGMVGHPMYKGPAPIVKDAASFGQWFVDSPFTNNTHSVATLQLTQLAMGVFRFSSDPNSVTGGFFPADPPGTIPAPGTIRMVPGTNEPLLCNLWPYWYSSAAFGAAANCKGDQYLFPPSTDPLDPACANPGAGMVPCAGGMWKGGMQGTFHNSWYSTEVRYLFTYNGPFALQFYGDDDLFIFINGHLAIDLGGVHQRLPGRVDVGMNGMATIIEGGEVGATGEINACATPNPYTLAVNNATCLGGTCDCRERTVDLGLMMGRTYEIAVFHADRHPTESNYQLTLSGFATNRSNCEPRCGDGVVTGSEECDDGPMNDDAAYGGCTTKCTFGPFCGDNVKNGPEVCDLGRMNVQLYGQRDGCTTTCALPHYCGDAVVDTANGEQCDQGETINGQADAKCDTKCKITIQ